MPARQWSAGLTLALAEPDMLSQPQGVIPPEAAEGMVHKPPPTHRRLSGGVPGQADRVGH